MKLGIFSGILMTVAVSLLSTNDVSARNCGGKESCCKKEWRGCHRSNWHRGHGYYYGPDGYYAKNKKGNCCAKEEKSCAKSCASKCEPMTFKRARYTECCGHGKLKTVN